MDYRIIIMPKAAKALAALPSDMRERIGRAVNALSDDMSGDVKKLTNFQPAYRLRVGNYRVLFDVEKDVIVVQRIAHRKDVYGRP